MRAAVSTESSLTAVPRAIMPLPDVIPVRRTEEEAGYVSFRPVVRQNFRLDDLLGLVLGVTGKHPERVRQILRAGSVSFHAYHYSWAGFPLEEHELTALLARFPDPDPSRPFRPEACTAITLEAGGSPSRHDLSGPRPILELERVAASRKRLFRRRSFWDALLAAASAGPLAYGGYSYQWRADLYRLDLGGELPAALAAQAKSLAPRDLHRNLRVLDRASHVVFICPREAA
jgi:hypothetical protein